MYNVTVASKIGGIETYYWEVSKELRRQGVDVEIVCGYGDKIKYDDIPIRQFGFIDRKKIPNFGNRFRKWAERVTFFWNAYKYLKTQKYDVFLVHKPFDFFVCCFMKLHDKSVKTVFISGGEDFYGFDRFFVKFVDYLFSVSRDNAEKIKSRYKRDVSVIPNGVDTKNFYYDGVARDELRQKYSLVQKKVLISVGRVVGWKGFGLVIDALVELDDFYYVLVGDGDYLEKLKIKAAKLGVDDRVLFLGAVDNKKLYKFLSMGDVFVQPSIGHEAFGITLVEAMSCGLPVVASRNGGMVDIVEDGKVGYCFEVSNIKDMTKKIKLCFENREAFSKNAVLHVKNNFTWESCVKQLLAGIRDVSVQ